MGAASKIKKAAKSVINPLRAEIVLKKKAKEYAERFEKYSFQGEKCIDERQYEAVITRWYHTIEKGLSYVDYRAGFGKDNVDKLLTAMENYVKAGYDSDEFFFKTALSCLAEYISKNREHGHEDAALKERVKALGGESNGCGGSLMVKPLPEEEVRRLPYKELVMDRHSFRHFAGTPVELERVEEAVALAQYTPSACNRQGWKARIIADREKIKAICENQNGNRGFGHEFDMMILVTGDLRCFNRSRELFQVFVDGGMYAESILNALHYYHIASVPLSASLTAEQEARVRPLVGMHDAEVPILLIGIGCYPAEEECLVARSERKKPEYEVIA